MIRAYFIVDQSIDSDTFPAFNSNWLPLKDLESNTQVGSSFLRPVLMKCCEYAVYIQERYSDNLSFSHIYKNLYVGLRLDNQDYFFSVFNIVTLLEMKNTYLKSSNIQILT